MGYQGLLSPHFIRHSRPIYIWHIIFSLASIIHWCIITARKNCYCDIDNSCENASRIRCYDSVGNLVYAKKTSIYCKLYNKNNRPHSITAMFTNGFIWIQRGCINKNINIRQLEYLFRLRSSWTTLGTQLTRHIWGAVLQFNLPHSWRLIYLIFIFPFLDH